MDLSGIIFVALAVGWAVYLVPKALQHHDELARSRSVESFSSRLRVLGARSRRAGAAPEPAAGSDSPSVEAVAAPAAEAAAPAAPAAPVAPVAPVASGTPVRRPVTRAAARRAAVRRRRVLYVLTFALAATATAAALSYLPWWSVAVPAGLIVAFLVIARLSVRRQSRPLAAPTTTAGDDQARRASGDAASGEPGKSVESEDTVGVARTELAVALDEPLADDGSLWDPLPMTLPTYVSKPHARRTVRTIELTRGVTSSGHDPADSRLVRDAEEQREEVAESTAGDQRRAAGA